MAKKRNYPDELCTYCAENKATTADHEPPKCLFLEPRPSNLITVPACDSCNHGLSTDQAYLRDYLITDFRVESHPSVPQLLAGKLARAVAANRSELGLTAQEHVRSGHHNRHVPIEGGRIFTTYQTMVRAFYYYLFEERLPADYIVSIFPADPNDSEAPQKVQRRIKGLGATAMTQWGENGDVLALMNRFPDQDTDPAITYCVMIFYLGVYVEAITHPPSLGSRLMYEAVCQLAEQSLADGDRLDRSKSS